MSLYNGGNSKEQLDLDLFKQQRCKRCINTCKKEVSEIRQGQNYLLPYQLKP